ncbi:putative gustatory receptor 28b [Nilaparvata lugens]|uniref:putative gustatory receptor 28b n=1 Tax=Nilaparvata lugens TaxID=108931 RepID=UPI00193DA216|nr:putative gustatory receptor 28b [Nilaparvata lugens]
MNLTCAKASSEAKRTSRIVSYLINRNGCVAEEEELEEFMTRLLHHRAEFSACGMFTLDRPLILVVAATITTYLVVMIQFLIANDSGESKTVSKGNLSITPSFPITNNSIE